MNQPSNAIANSGDGFNPTGKASISRDSGRGVFPIRGEEMSHLQVEFVTAASPVSRFLGHSLAVAFGFCGLAMISLIPITAVKLLIWLGVDQLAGTLHGLETLLLIVDIGLFGVVFMSGVAVFLAETLASSIKQIKSAWRKK